MSPELKGILLQIEGVNKSPSDWVHYFEFQNTGNTLLSIASDCFCTGQNSKSSKRKNSLASMVFPGTMRQGQIKDSVLGMGLLRSSNPILSLAVAALLRFSLGLPLVGVQGYQKATYGEMPQSSLFLSRFRHFPWIKATYNSFQVISRVLNKLTCPCSYCFYEDDFQRSLLCYFCWWSPTCGSVNLG